MSHQSLLYVVPLTSSRQLSTRPGSTNQDFLRNRVITDLKKEQDAAKLLKLISDEVDRFNGVNYGNAWSSLASMKKHHGGIRSDPRFRRFIADTAKRITDDRAGELLSVQSHANIMHSIAKLGVSALDVHSITSGMISKGEWLVKNGNSQDVANTCWAFATLGVHAPSLFAAVDKNGRWLVETGTQQAVANTCWAFATLGVQAPSLFAAVDKNGWWLVETGTQQAVANTCWAFASLGVQAPSFFAAVDKNGRWLVENAKPQHVANTCWAAVVLGLLGRNNNLVRECWNAAMAIPLNSLSSAALLQLHEIYLCIQIEGGEELKSSLLSMPLDLREAIDKADAESLNGFSPSQSAVVSTILTRIGFNHEVEVSPFSNNGCNAQFMDIDIFLRDRMIVIQFNGPFHYNSDGLPNGKTMLKKRLLEKRGWQLHTINWRKWADLKSEAGRVDFLKRIVELNTGWVEA
jgi:hypothetical protein